MAPRVAILRFITIALCFSNVALGVCVDSSPPCNGRGKCRSEVCDCIIGFHDDPATPVSDCSKAVPDDYPVLWEAEKAVFLALFLVLIVLSMTGVLFAYRANTRRAAFVITASNLRRIVLLITSVTGVLQAVLLIHDPKFKTELATEWGLWGFNFPASFAIYVAILCHWIDLYNLSVAALKREEMFQKINQNYHGKEITLEDVAAKVRFLSKFRVPMLSAVVVLFTLYVATVISIAYMPGTTPLPTVFYIYLILNWVVMAFGFLFYGRKLVSLMPSNLFKQVRSLTRRVTILVIVYVLSIAVQFIVNQALNSSEPEYYMIMFLLIETTILSALVVTVLMFVRPNKHFPFCFRAERALSGGSTSNNSEMKGNESSSTYPDDQTASV